MFHPPLNHIISQVCAHPTYNLPHLSLTSVKIKDGMFYDISVTVGLGASNTVLGYMSGI